MRKDGSGLPAFVVLYTSMRELAWPDYLDEETAKQMEEIRLGKEKC